MLYFITGNKNKFDEAKAILGVDMKQLDIDLPEIQDIDPHKIIEAKLHEARKHHKGEFIVADTLFSLEVLGNKLPGPFIRWFLETIGPEGIAEIARKMGNNRATSTDMLGYLDHRGKVKFFEGVVNGAIVSPRGDKDWGWGPIFVPDGYEITYGEMERNEKNKISHRKIALEKLKNFLEE